MSLNKKGDTIVEVMIVLAVLGMALTISYVTASRALSNIRAAQESSTATKMLQTQVEKLRLLGPISNASVPATNIFRATDFCIDNTGQVKDSTDVSCNDISGQYDMNISYCDLSTNTVCAGLSGQSTFIARISWRNVRGQGTDTATMLYRVFK